MFDISACIRAPTMINAQKIMECTYDLHEKEKIVQMDIIDQKSRYEISICN